jgi:hypothetical protein
MIFIFCVILEISPILCTFLGTITQELHRNFSLPPVPFLELNSCLHHYRGYPIGEMLITAAES